MANHSEPKLVLRWTVGLATPLAMLAFGPGCASRQISCKSGCQSISPQTIDLSQPSVLGSISCRTELSGPIVLTEDAALGTSIASAPAAEVQYYPIDLPAALRLADSQNTLIALARERIAEAQAQYVQADLLLLPTLGAGANYHHHDGRIQDVAGDIVDASRTAGYAGLGAGALGAASVPFPGVSVRSDLADAIFLPLAARQNVRAREAESRAVLNSVLLNVAGAYLELLRVKGELAIAEESYRNAAELARVTEQFAEAGEGLQSDAERAAVERSIRQNDVERGRENLTVRSAQLAELLRLDPQLQLNPLDTIIVPVRIISDDQSLADLVRTALESRPEVDQNRALVQLACERLRHARYGPLLPSVLLGVSAGGFGGGQGSTLGSASDRTDYDALVFWELRNLGMGDRALAQERRSQYDQAVLAEIAVLDRVGNEVTQAHAQVVSRRKQIDIASSAVERAQNSFRLNRARIFEKQGLPIEVLQAIQSLAATQREYLNSVIDYNIAQYRLYTALGQPASGAAYPR
jgi:outer membrane protein TolC